MSEYDEMTAVRSVGGGEYAVELAPGWVVGGGVNGGYLLGLIGRALRTELPDKPEALAVSAHFLSAATPGPGMVRVGVRREGGSVATVSVDLLQDDTVRISALATCGDLGRLADRAAERGGTEHRFAAPFDLPPPEECVASGDAPAPVKAFVPMLDRFDLRLDPAHAAWGRGEAGMGGQIQGWFRFPDDREPDTLSLLTVCDVLPPVTFDLGMPGWAPTLELPAYVRARPAPGWLKVRHATKVLAGGLFEEDCEVWDSTDALVAQSRQLALEPRPLA